MPPTRRAPAAGRAAGRSRLCPAAGRGAGFVTWEGAGARALSDDVDEVPEHVRPLSVTVDYPPASAFVTATARSRFIAPRIAPICFSLMHPKIRVAVASSSRSMMGAASSGRMLW